MRVLAGVVLLLAVFSATEAAVLVRFLNTVPTVTSVRSIYLGAINTYDNHKVSTAGSIADVFADPNKWNCRADGTPSCTREGDQGWPARYRYPAMVQKWDQYTVGLYYYASAVNSPLTHATVVYTEPPQANWQDLGSKDTQQIAWMNSMPPLRAYHRPVNADRESSAADRIVNQEHFSAASTNVPYRVAVADYYTPDTLKADGVGLYMSFAPGTYQFEAYGVAKSSVAKGAGFQPPYNFHGVSPFGFTGSAISLTFEDNKVYTIVATGKGSWTDSPTTKHTVRLWNVEESTAPTKFGMAAIRFYHAIGHRPTDTLDIYHGQTKIHSGLAYAGGTTPYFDVAPAQSSEFPVALSASGAPSTSGDATNLGFTFHLNAGTRATAFCAVNSEDRSSETFCRMIPSRVVAYVRLVADTAGFDGLVIGKFGPQKLSQTPLSLWGSYEYPTPHQTSQGNRDMGTANTAGIPAAGTGLYPVVYDVAPGTISGYGEVHVPVFIMDFAVTTRMTPSCTDEVYSSVVVKNRGYLRTKAGGTCLNRAHGLLRKTGFRVQYSDSWQNFVRNAIVANNNDREVLAWHEHAPVFKRVNLVLKTDGFATISNDCNDNDFGAWNFQQGVLDIGTASNAGGAPKNQYSHGGLGTAMLTDLYMEPGELYSVMIMPQTARTGYTHCSGGDFLNTVTFKTGNTRESDQPDPAIQTGKNYRFAISRDVSVHQLSQGVTGTQAQLTFVSMGDRKNWAELDIPNTPAVAANAAAAGIGSATASKGIGKPRPDQQDFEGTITFTLTGGASTKTESIDQHATNFRELIPRWRYGSYPAETIRQSPFPRGVSDWEGLDTAEMGRTDGTHRYMLDGCHKSTDAACGGARTSQGYAKPDAPKAVILTSGEYDMTHTAASDNVNPVNTAMTLQTATDECFNTIPDAKITLEGGKMYHYYVLNQFGCMRTSDGALRSSPNLDALKGVLVEVAPFVAATPSPVVSTIESGASSISASLTVCFAALLVIIAFVF